MNIFSRIASIKSPIWLKAILLKLGERCLIRANFGLFLWQWELRAGEWGARVTGATSGSHPPAHSIPSSPLRDDFLKISQANQGAKNVLHGKACKKQATQMDL